MLVKRNGDENDPVAGFADGDGGAGGVVAVEGGVDGAEAERAEWGAAGDIDDGCGAGIDDVADLLDRFDVEAYLIGFLRGK